MAINIGNIQAKATPANSVLSNLLSSSSSLPSEGLSSSMLLYGSLAIFALGAVVLVATRHKKATAVANRRRRARRNRRRSHRR